jgi:hypothetical protein
MDTLTADNDNDRDKRQDKQDKREKPDEWLGRFHPDLRVYWGA